MNGWTDAAKERWEQLPAGTQQMILDHVWCPHCGRLRTMQLEGGAIIVGDLVITGSCAVCGRRTARLLEFEPLHGADTPSFQPGDAVIWLKRLPGGSYVVPLAATVLALTPKRVKIRADEDGQIMTRSVPAESLQRRT